MDYTPSQAAAIACTDQNLQLIACAGSGKTQVISARIVEILKRGREKGVGPASIVAFTFTEKAAAELKDRISRLVKRDIGEVPGLAEMYVGTIHGFCLALLQTGLYRYLKYGVLSDVQNRLFVARNSQKSGLSRVEIISGPGQGQLLTRKDIKIYLETLNVIREDNVDPSQLPAALLEARDLYADLLERHAYLDFSGIMVEAVAALYDREDEESLRLQDAIRGRVRYVVVDEYQDVNPIQEALVRRLHQLGANVCVVGDDDQTIYQWRGSAIRNILDFRERYPAVQSVTLAENFRSSDGVVQTGRRIAEVNDPNRLPKKMLAAGHQTYERGDLLALTFDSPEAEAAWIVQKIQQLRGVPFQDERDAPPRGLSWADMAILLRSVRRNGEPIVVALKAAGIPYLISGLAGLFDTPEIDAAVSLFRYIDGDLDEAAVRSVWAAADLGLTPGDLDAGVAVLNRARTWKPGERWASYNIQRTYLDFLEAVGFREERIPPTLAGALRGEIVFYNLGKFSQVISDFEQIYFQTEPQEKYRAFAQWLQYEAPDYYEEGAEDAGFAQPDAVHISTVHQAKGMEWPVVFIPALLKNRFPAAGIGGRTKWHILPRAAVPDADRYDSSESDERRLFYVAATRSKKYLFCTFAPIPDNRKFQKASPFFREFTGNPLVLTSDPSRAVTTRITPTPRRETPNVVLSFSELKYFFECPYQFKLRFLYGFNAPLHEALGFGKSLHDVLAEVHKRALDGEIVGEDRVEPLVDKHLHAPFAYPELKAQLRKAAIESVGRYLKEHGAELAQTIHSEKQVEIQVAPGITVNGRIDLIRRLDTGEVSIVDFKSSEKAQAERVSRVQLHTYALGYRQLTGTNADVVEILNLDSGGTSLRELVDASLVEGTKAEIRRAGDALRENRLPRLAAWCTTCASCDMQGVCRKSET